MSRILYQILTEPVLPPAQQPEQVTESRWHQPLAVPILKAGLTAAVVASGAFWPPIPLAAETVTLDKWCSPLSGPVRSIAQVDVSGATETRFVPSTTIGWFRSLSIPTYRGGLDVVEQPALTFVKAAPFAETVTADRWQQPLPRPVLRPWFPEYPAFSYSYYIAPSTEVITLDKWYRPMAEPVRVPPALATASQPYLSLVKAAPFPETVTVDRWGQPLSIPVLRSGLSAGQIAASGVTEARFLPTAIGWFQPLSAPTYRGGLLAANDPAFSYSYFVSIAAVTVDSWLRPLDEPVRVRPSLGAASQPYLSFVKAAPFAEAVTADRWQQSLSVPVLRTRFAEHRPFSYSYYVTPETITLDKWWRALSEPVRRRSAASWGFFTDLFTDPSPQGVKLAKIFVKDRAKFQVMTSQSSDEDR